MLVCVFINIIIAIVAFFIGGMVGVEVQKHYPSDDLDEI